MSDRVEQALAMVSRLTSAESAEDASKIFVAALEPFGATYFRMDVIRNVASGGSWSVDNWPDHWRTYMIDEGGHWHDPVRRGYRHGRSFSWDETPAQNAVEREHLANAAAIGMKKGFGVISRTPNGRGTSVQIAGEDLRWTELERGVIEFLANAFVNRLLYLREYNLQPDIVELSPRETEILSFAAAGHSDKEIALATGISVQTVHTHWKRIRQKLHVTDRVEAVSVGIVSGQIFP